MERRTEKIVLSDGRRGRQTRFREEHWPEGEWQLSEVTITKEADGTACYHVYARQSDFRAHIFSLADLGNVSWKIV